MKIKAIETLRADAGWRMFSFLKITTDTGIVGWSEFNESFGSAGLKGVIDALGEIRERLEAGRLATALITLITRQRRQRSS